jgi:hypothetical protein
LWVASALVWEKSCLLAGTMRRLLGAVSTYCHAAPAARVTACFVQKDHSASLSFAGFHVGKIFKANHFRHRFSKRE